MSIDMKRALRKELHQRLKALSKDYIDTQSALVAERLFAMPQFQRSRALSVYISMPSGEVMTDSIIRKGFEDKKRLFIPKIVGKRSEDMFKLEVSNYETITNFPKNSWGIPEPSIELVQQSSDGTYAGLIDLVVLPGVAFDRQCNRLGHGKGYYDCFISRLITANAEQGKPAPYLVAIALDEQIVDTIPMEPHDRALDAVITPSAVYFRETGSS